MGKCGFLLSRSNKWAWLPTVTLLLNVLRRGAWQPGTHLFLILRGQASTSPPHHVYLHHCPDSPQACAEAGYLQVPSVFIIGPRREDNRASPNPCDKKPPRQPDCLAQGI